MAKYHLNNDDGGTQQNLSSSFKTLVSVRATTGDLRRGKVYDIIMGTNGTPADAACEFDVSRLTAVGTATASTPEKLDSADSDAAATGAVNNTIEGTITANSSCFFTGSNVRTSYRWVAAPGGELVFPATADNGFALRALCPTGYTSTATGALFFEEL